MNEINNKILEEQDLQSMLNLAENLQFQNLEGMVNAHKVYNIVLDKLLEQRNKKTSNLIGLIHQKLWEIEKKFGYITIFSELDKIKLFMNIFSKNVRSQIF